MDTANGSRLCQLLTSDNNLHRVPAHFGCQRYVLKPPGSRRPHRGESIERPRTLSGVDAECQNYGEPHLGYEESTQVKLHISRWFRISSAITVF